MKIMIGLVFVGILAALGFAGFAMLRPKTEGEKAPNMAKALAWRIGLSVFLFLFVLLMYKLNYLQPKGLVIGQ